VRGYDVRTGKRLWLFRTIPQLGEFGNDTWEKAHGDKTGNTGVWAQISVDRSWVSPICRWSCRRTTTMAASARATRCSARASWRSICRPASANGTPARASRHLGHGHPVRADSRRHHRQRPDRQGGGAAVQTGLPLRLRSVTGQPIWPIAERPAPKGDVPGEAYSPTQPIRASRRPNDRQGLAIDDLIDFTPELRAEATKLVARYKVGPVFTPPVVSKAEGPIATLAMATQAPATNWPGGSYDPETTRSTSSRRAPWPRWPRATASRHGRCALSPGHGVERSPHVGRLRCVGSRDSGGAVQSLEIQGLRSSSRPTPHQSIDLDQGELQVANAAW